MRHRQAVALLALVGLMLSVYLTMYHYGLVGALACGASASCDKVQASRYAVFLGLPVAAYGVGGYLALLVVALAGLQDRFAGSVMPTRMLALLSGLGAGFTAWLKYLEVFRIHAICRWCVVSAVIITLIFAISLLSLRTPPSAEPRS